jgi:predicted transcriptional regulator
MESTTLIPYSVHLKRDIHAKLKEAAGNRKAASLVRDAITSYIEGGAMYDSGYRAGLRDAMNMVCKDEASNSIALN